MIIDGHADTLSRIARLGERLESNSGHFDVSRAQTVGVDLQILSLFSSERDGNRALEDILLQIDYYEQEMMSCGGLAYSVRCFNDIDENIGRGKVGLMLHLEGAEALGTKMSNLRTLYRLGVRSVGLTWNNRNFLADGVRDSAGGGGLTKWGREVIAEMNCLGMLVDLAHISPPGFFDAIEVAEKPLVVSHANSFNICNHPRNLSDEQLRILAQADGVVGVTFVPEFISGPEASIKELVAHVNHMLDIMGDDHVAFGSDFDGTENTVVKDVGSFPLLIEELRKQGLSATQIDKLLRGNYLRILKSVL